MEWELIITIFASAGFWAFATEVYKTKSKKKTPHDRLIEAVAKDKLNYLSKKYMRLGGIIDDEHSTFMDLGEAYIACELNSDVKDRFEKAKKLPIIFEEDNKELID